MCRKHLVVAVAAMAYNVAPAQAALAYTAPPMAPPAGPPAGWYPDPAGAPVHRWWDGGRWTEHTA